MKYKKSYNSTLNNLINSLFLNIFFTFRHKKYIQYLNFSIKIK